MPVLALRTSPLAPIAASATAVRPRRVAVRAAGCEAKTGTGAKRLAVPGLIAGAAAHLGAAGRALADVVDPNTGEVYKKIESVQWKFLPDAGTDPMVIVSDVATGICVLIAVGYILGSGSLVVPDPDKKDRDM